MSFIARCVSPPPVAPGSTRRWPAGSWPSTAPPAGPAARPRALDLLTGREREVLGLIGQGHTNAEIARRLFVGEGTVKTHVNHLFTKLNLRDRAAAIIFAYDNDIIDHDG